MSQRGAVRQTESSLSEVWVSREQKGLPLKETNPNVECKEAAAFMSATAFKMREKISEEATDNGGRKNA